MKKLLSLITLLFVGSLAFSQITITSTVTNATCFGGATGSATIISTGGNAPYTYSITAPPQSNGTGIFSGLLAGTYSVIVSDAIAATNSITFTVTEPTALIATTTATNELCQGTASGAIDVMASGGTPPYLYNLAGGSYISTSLFPNQPAGVQIVSVKDANNCVTTQTAVVLQTTAYTASITSINHVTCFGLADGNASAGTFGGAGGPYTYSWSPGGQSSATATNLTAGIYSVTITNFGGCTATATVNIFQPSPLNAIINANNALCFGTNTGTVTVSGTGGNAPYSYFWTTLASTSATVSNISAGLYPVIVTDANNCSLTQTVLVNQPNQITTSITSTNTSCGGTCDGAFNINVTGGVAPYTFANSSLPCMAFNTSQCAGTKTITITDANNCILNWVITINQPTPITAVITATNSNCGQANGALCATFSGGNSPYTSIWSNGVTVLCNNLIPAGAYSYTVTDQNGCSAVANGLVNDIGGPNISISSQTNVSCFGGNNGAVSTTVTGGTSPYTYVWTIGGSQSSISGVSAGMYGVTVTDAAGCVGTQSVLINQPQQLTASISNFSNACASNCNGSASVLAMGGTAGYTFSWNTAPPQIGTTLTNVCSGSWTCLVTDIKGCMATTSVTISQLPNSTLTINHSNVSCGNPCSGAATASVTGGVIVSFLWQPGLQASAMINNLCAGTYTLNATTNNGCVYTDTVSITNAGMNAIPNATLSTTVIDETCLNNNDGNIDLTINGTNPGPFTYQWSNGATTEDVFNIATGSYYVTVYDASLNCLNIVTTVTATGVNCGSIVGNVFIDNNSDCIKNSGDNNLYNTQIFANPGNRIGYTNLNGDYAFYNLPFGNYTITANTNTVTTQSTCGTNSLTTTINSTTPNSINNNFVRKIIPPTQPDLYVSAYSIGIVPGFVCRMNYLLHNYNTFNTNGILKVTLPSAFIPNITNAFPAAYTVSGDTVIWNFNNINYIGANVNFYIDFTTPLSTTLGSTFMACMWAQPTVTDANYTNNNFCYQRPVTGSFDPNDKTVSPVGYGINGDITATETDLTYLIRFQNTGNGPAVNIVVKDTLSPNVDINTFEMLSASHNYNIDILPGNVLRWKFNNIMLADSGSNEPASHGYIQYRIKRTNNNTPGTQIKNTAYIYFDFNAPVVTNTAINTIETITEIKSSFSTKDEWNVYPNPSTGVLYIVNSSSVKEASQIQVINSIGQTVLEESITNNYKNIDLSKLNNGVYFVKIVSDKNSIVKRIVLSK